MSKSIKLKDDNYLDSSGIIHYLQRYGRATAKTLLNHNEIVLRNKSTGSGTTTSFNIAADAGYRNTYWYSIIANGGYGRCAGIIFINNGEIVEIAQITGSVNVTLTNGILTFTTPRNYANVTVFSADWNLQ